MSIKSKNSELNIEIATLIKKSTSLEIEELLKGSDYIVISTHNISNQDNAFQV